MKKGYIYIILSAVMFSTMEVAGKLVSKDINPFELNFLRFIIGAIILLPLAVKDIRINKVSFNKRDVGYFLITGLLCVVVSMSFFQLAIVYAKASTVAIVFSINPVFTIPFACWLLKEKLTKRTLLSLIISILGIICILNPFKLNSDIIGIVLAILSALIFSLYSVIGKMHPSKYGSITFNCITFLCGSLEMLIIILISNLPFIVKLNAKIGLNLFSNMPILYGVNSNNIFTLIYLGVIVTGLGYLFYFFAMDETSATTASIVFFIKPALAPVISLVILHENIPFNTLLGIILILIGSCITLIKKQEQPQVTE